MKRRIVIYSAGAIAAIILATYVLITFPFFWGKTMRWPHALTWSRHVVGNPVGFALSSLALLVAAIHLVLDILRRLNAPAKSPRIELTKTIASALTIIAALVYLRVEIICHPFLELALFLFTVFVLIPAFLIFAVISVSKNLTAATIRCVLVVAAIVASFFVSCTTENEMLRLSQRKGDRIIAALNEYKSEKGHYPETLQQLVPQYVAEIPHPTLGIFTEHEFYYYKSRDEDEYSLSFCYVAFTVSSYSSQNREWIVDD